MREKGHDMSKTSEVLQRPDDSPNQFYEHLCEAFCTYSSLIWKPLKTSGR
jgi:hypothetical protein